MTTETSGERAATILRIAPSLIAPSLTNPRKSFPEASLRELGISMRLDGQVQAAIVRYLPGNRIEETFRHRNEGEALPIYELAIGERRWRAAKLENIDLLVEVRDLSDMQVIRMQIIENLHREDVHPLEEAEGYDYLLRQSDVQITTQQIADELGKSRDYVVKRMKLLDLSDESREAFRAGVIDTTVALHVARVPGAALQAKALADIRQMGANASFRSIENMLRQRYRLRLATAPFDVADGTLLENCGNCVACPKRTGNQPLLFDDVDDADVCTDPDCFDAKRKASIQRTLDEAKAKGWTVLEGDAAREVKRWPGEEPKGYEQLNDAAYQDADGKDVTWFDLWERAAGKKQPGLTLLVHPQTTGSMPDRLLSNEAAQALIKKFPPPKKAKGSDAGVAAGDTPRSKQMAAQERAAWQHRYGVTYARLLETALRADNVLQAKRTIEDLRLIVMGACEEIGPDGAAMLGMAVDRYDEFTTMTEACREALKLATVDQMAALLFWEMTSAYGVHVPELEASALSHGIDLDELRARARDDAGEEPPGDSQDPDADEIDDVDAPDLDA